MSSDWDDEDADDSEDVQTHPCQFCGAMIYEEAQRRPECGKYVTAGEQTVRRPIWFWIGLVLVLLIVFFIWIKHG